MPPPDNKVSLGCGTLILIALIVMIFGNANRSGDKKTAEQLRKLQSDVSSLKTDMQEQKKSLESIKTMIGEIQNARSSARPRVTPPAGKPTQMPTPEAPLPEN